MWSPYWQDTRPGCCRVNDDECSALQKLSVLTKCRKDQRSGSIGKHRLRAELEDARIFGLGQCQQTGEVEVMRKYNVVPATRPLHDIHIRRTRIPDGTPVDGFEVLCAERCYPEWREVHIYE